MSWDSIKASLSDGDFVKIKAGESVLIHILGGEPEMKTEHFVNKKPQKCTGKDCHLCNEGVDQRVSWSISVFNLTAKRQEILNQGRSVFKQIMEIRETYGGDLKGVDLKIKRDGSGPMDTKYTVIPVPTAFKPEMIVEGEPADEKESEIPF
jgi:hypothetical protein